ncbi:MAG: alpha/beta hydrolase [Bacteroidales bacterium]|nr:alpha/beta hydrolase [Bacteroidales bacterium]
MQYRLFIIPILALSVMSLQSCTDIMCLISGYRPSEIRNDLQTPEPGTDLTPRSKLVLKHAARYAANPDSVYDTKKYLLKLMKPWIRDVQDLQVAAGEHEIPVRIYCNIHENKRDSLPVILFFHGGGFIWGDIDKFDSYCRKVAIETGSILISAGYRLAPEHPFPAAVNDARTVHKWAYDNIVNYGGDPEKIIVMGESAGANLAAVTSLMSRDSCGPPVFAQVICCPVTTFEEKIFPSRRYFMLEGETYMISEDYMHRCREAYLPGNIDVSHPYISPLRADVDGNIPPALVITARVDPLRDEGKAYAYRLKEGGVKVIYREYEGMIHAFMNFYLFLEEGWQAIEEVDYFIDNL